MSPSPAEPRSGRSHGSRSRIRSGTCRYAPCGIRRPEAMPEGRSPSLPGMHSHRREAPTTGLRGCGSTDPVRKVARDGQHSGVVVKPWVKVIPCAPRSRLTAGMNWSDPTAWSSVVTTTKFGGPSALGGRWESPGSRDPSWSLCPHPTAVVAATAATTQQSHEKRAALKAASVARPQLRPRPPSVPRRPDRRARGEHQGRLPEGRAVPPAPARRRSRSHRPPGSPCPRSSRRRCRPPCPRRGQGSAVPR